MKQGEGRRKDIPIKKECHKLFRKQKSKKTGSVSHTELCLIPKGVTATSEQGKLCSVNGAHLSGAESMASVWAGGACVGGREWQAVSILSPLTGGLQDYNAGGCFFLTWRICLVSFLVVLTCIYTFALHWSATPCHNDCMFYYTTFTTLNVYIIYYIW